MSGDFIAYHAKARPDRLAVVDLAANRSADYRTLDDLVARCVGYLKVTLGDCTGVRVGALMRSRLEVVVLHYACLRSGAIFVPLNWRLAGPELAVVVEDAAPALVVYESEFAEAAEHALRGVDALTLVVGPEGRELRDAIEAQAPAEATPAPDDAPWTLLYTSGTTGRPKGVIITGYGSLWGSLNLSMIADITQHSVMLCDPPLFHTVGLFGICRTALVQGATVILSDRFLPGPTLQRLSDPGLGVTHYFGVPQIGQMLIAEPGFETADFSRLRAVLMGGAPLPRAVAERFADRGVPVANGFGMTETCSLMHMPLDLERIREKPSAVGFPPPFVQVRIVSPDGQDVADGEVGEIWLKGPSITPGYWNQPEASAKALAGGWFHTGDAARRHPDGAYEIVDRWKDMYISGGENVYPAEVEAAIGLLPQVAEVAVVGAPSEKWGECGVAFIVVRPGSDLPEDQVRAHCAEHLAGYKRPTVVRFVDTLPRTGTGKVQKQALRAMIGA